ncbi:MAG TPA: hypothetical protein VL092_06875 [Chitinophagaceae bacterium]|nr:hypothetical protein [Chitinophagaceae bacterium]
MKFGFSFLLIGLLSGNAIAQKCDGFYLLQNGKTITMSNYGRKDKPVGTVVYKISDVKKAGTGLSATVNTQVFDDKQESVSTGEATVECSGGQYKVDMRMMLNQQQTKQLKKYKAKADFFVEYPSGMKVGEVLKDASFTLNGEESDGIGADMEITIDERTVLAQEKVTTPAGTWDCFKIKSHVTMKASMGGISIPFSTDNMEWFAPGFGIVKTETKSSRSEISSIQ